MSRSCFKCISERYSDVKQAHKTTFEWIFEPNASVSFARWPESSDGIYWITGHAGSGKSTLMKFLLKDVRTRKLLQKWLGDDTLVIVSHFFWSSGTQVQKSQDGLLRTLLSQIMIEHGEVIPHIVDQRWHDGSLKESQSWTRKELVDTFTRLAELRKFSTRYCLFIDGLDEYDGDHQELAQLLHSLARSPNIKICASSRPWNEFIAAFGNSAWKLSAHELTSEDVKRYIQDSLEQDPHFQELQGRTPSATQCLIHSVHNKAQGVFLWVYLVVRSLLRGFANRDDLNILLKRLDESPPSLTRYFQHMMDTIEAVYRSQTARIFRVMITSHSTIPLIGLYFLDMEEHDPSYALTSDIQVFSVTELEAIYSTKRWRLNAQCRDLLQITDHLAPAGVRETRVGFLHRTVKDFLDTKDIATRLKEWSGANFEPNSSLCKMFYAQIRASHKAGSNVTDNKTVLQGIMGTLMYAREVE
ncbi:hypothetical protein EJ08DRAFT_672191 [Tothia fuscella]|uniref:NACHT domain-containing protein n=1 Tax=Tothia fuscella TaxID=1048955 RepID=A0A9P4NKM8_9PEZI|nr:hypothetical protein EJ08DRAFT_672191 [Tothia fuscella]